MNDNHKFWQAGNMQIDEMEAAEGKIPMSISSEVETIALPVGGCMTCEAWRLSFQSSEQAAKSAYAEVEKVKRALSELLDLVELAPEDVPYHEYETIREYAISQARKAYKGLPD